VVVEVDHIIEMDQDVLLFHKEDQGVLVEQVHQIIVLPQLQLEQEIHHQLVHHKEMMEDKEHQIDKHHQVEEVLEEQEETDLQDQEHLLFHYLEQHHNLFIYQIHLTQE
jgi:hypothetical protein